MTTTAALAGDLDPVTFEVLRNALLAITEETDGKPNSRSRG